MSIYFFPGLRMLELRENVGKEENKEKIKKVLTHDVSCGIINPALRTARDARVVELVDSLASGASARKGVRVRLPPRAPPKIRNPKVPDFFVQGKIPLRAA